MTKPVIVTDVDSVLLDWIKGFSNFLKSKGIDTEHLNSYIGTTKFLDVSFMTGINCEKTNKILLQEFSKSNFIKELESFQHDSKKHIQELHKEVDFIALSCLSKDPFMQNKRRENLQNVYGNVFKKVFCIDFGESKEHKLLKINNRENIICFVDDRLKHIKESINAGIPAILFSRNVEEHLFCPNESFRTKHCWGEIKESVLLELELQKKTNSIFNKNNLNWATPEFAERPSNFSGGEYELLNVKIADVIPHMHSSMKLDLNSENGGVNGIGSRLPRAKQHFLSGQPMDLPELGCNSRNNVIDFTNGRHRTVAAYQLGNEFIPMFVDKNNIEKFKSLVETKPVKNLELLQAFESNEINKKKKRLKI